MEHTIPLQPLKQGAVTVITCGDRGFIAPAGVLFRSILDHRDPERFYDLVFLHNGVEEPLLRELSSLLEGMEQAAIRTLDISPVFSGEGLYTENRDGISAMTYARLVIPQVLSPEYDRVLYLDGDMIAFRDVGELYDSDLQGKPLGSTVDFGVLACISEEEAKRDYVLHALGLENPEDYCMAAVLVMDLKELREHLAPGELLTLARSRSWNWHDQDVINHRFRGQLCHLDPRWDVILPEHPHALPKPWRDIFETAIESPFLFHFAGSGRKPWEGFRCPYGVEFWEIARRTPFYSRLMGRLQSQPSAYSRLYSKGKTPEFLRRLLPPPVKACQRDLKNILETLDEGTRQQLDLLRRCWTPLLLPEVSGEDTPLPLSPLFPEAVTLVCCGDEAFAAPAAVLFRSVIDHADPDKCYDLIYLHNGLSDFSRAGMLALEQDNVRIRTCDIRPLFSGEGLYTENRRDLSSMAYARLLIPQALGEDYHRALYLDGDMVACRDVAPLFASDLRGCPLGSTLDIPSAAEAQGDIISGMLVMDLPRIREEFPPGELLALAASRSWQRHDQSVINFCFRDRICLLDPRWDSWDPGELMASLTGEQREETLRTLRDPFIFHFAGGGRKPWERTFPRGGHLFWQTAARTVFYPVLLRRLHRKLNTYETCYPQGGKESMLKGFLKKILPPPVSSVQRDLKTVLDALEEQKQLGFFLLQQLEQHKTGDPSVAPVAKVPNLRLRFEFSLASHCNLRCRGCSHFAPLAEEAFPDFEETEASFARLSRLFDGECEEIHLLGGEPLLNPRCGDYLVMARRYFPVGTIQLVTNGLLLPQMGEDFYRICRENRIVISVTPYPISLSYEDLRRKCETQGVEFRLYMQETPKTTFNKMALDLAGEQDPRENFRNCNYSGVCLFLRQGRMYPCGIGAHLGIFEERFHRGLELTEEDSVDIFAVESGQELLLQLAKAVPMCRYCHLPSRETQVPWGKSECAISEWT